MATLQVTIKDTEKIKKILLKKDLINHDYKYKKDKTYFYFPIKKKITIPNTKIVTKTLEKRIKKETTLKAALKYYLPPEELKLLKTAFDIVGDIAILEIPEILEPKEQIIAEELLKINKNIKTVLKKSTKNTGQFRLKLHKYLAGKRTKTSIHKENNIKLKINVDKTYFSIRSATERKRITQLVKPNENILVMFSGAAPYPIALSKNTEAKHITGIEINPEAHKLAQDNLILNKIKNITLINKDIRETKLTPIYDRIVMPLPKTAEEFLPIALKISKPNTVIHLYAFLREDEFKQEHKKIRDYCKQANKKCRILKTTKCGNHAPRVYRVCIDIKIV